MKKALRKICVFCGSSTGANPEYSQAVRALGTVFIKNGLTLIYGGGSVGLMGELARSVLEGGGGVIGVIPERIHRMVEALQLTELHVVENMYERKARMYDLSDAFIVLPGGIGTIEEFFEVYTWYQLGIHLKPFGVLNVSGYFNKLLEFVDHMVGQGFLKPAHRDVLVVEENPQALIARLQEKELVYIAKLSDSTNPL
jgi:uncharacterized protein (TIGR00730 family)